MAFAHRTPPLTPLDTLRALLAGYAEGDSGFATKLVQSLQQLRRTALRELGAVLARPQAPKSLKRAIYGLVGRFDWPEWVPLIRQALEGEPELVVFDEACATLGVLGMRSAQEALVTLRQVRSEPDRQVILQREVSLYEPQQPFAHYYGRLMEGSGNLRLAHQGAKYLSVLATPQDLGALQEAYRTGDELTQRLALKVMASVPSDAVPTYFLEQLETLRIEYEDALQLQGVLQKAATVARTVARDEFLKLVVARFQETDPGPASFLATAVGREDVHPASALEQLRQRRLTAFETFLVESVGLLLESKVARFTAYVSETQEATQARCQVLHAQAEFLAETLAWWVGQGRLEVTPVLKALAPAFATRLGQDGLLLAYLQLIPPEDTASLEALLAEPEVARRQKYLDALGIREADALTPFFLRAMQDPIVEVGQLAIHHLGRLPSSLPALMAMFESGQVDQIRRAISVFGENQTAAAAEPLVAFLQRESRDDLLVEAVEALTHIRHRPAAPVFLEFLHDGKPLALQVALVRALGALETSEASLGLLAKAPALKQPAVLIQALEGALGAFSGFEHPLPVEEVSGLIALVERCCDEREGEGQRLRAMLACEGLYTFDRQAYDTLKDRFSDFLFDMRTKEAWDRENNDRVAAIIKELGRRSESLGLLAKKEQDIRQRMTRIPESGPKRIEELLALREALADPAMILRPEMAQEVADRVAQELQRPSQEWREVAHLCEIGGLTRHAELGDAIRDIYQRAQGLGLKSAAREALLKIGLEPRDLDRLPPVRRILVLEPSSFFRKRLMNALLQGPGWEVLEAGSRLDAQSVLDQQLVDVILSESQDGEGDLIPWLEQQWAARRCRSILLSTSDRGAGAQLTSARLLGLMFKPYPLELLVDILGS